MLDGGKASVNSKERGMFVIRLQHLKPAHLNELFITVHRCMSGSFLSGCGVL